VPRHHKHPVLHYNHGGDEETSGDYKHIVWNSMRQIILCSDDGVSRGRVTRAAKSTLNLIALTTTNATVDKRSNNGSPCDSLLVQFDICQK
jgi:hypothetical protein